MFALELLLDSVDLPRNIMVIGREAADSSQVLNSLSGAVGLDEPPRRLWLEKHEKNQKLPGSSWMPNRTCHWESENVDIL
jgi:hypothetical protein